MSRNYINFPKILEYKDYDTVSKEVAQALADVAGVHGVYLLGDTWQPGVSDLDLLVVCQEGSQPRLLNPWSFGEPAAYMFTHRYLSMDAAAAKKFFYLFPPETTHARLIAGKEINFDDPRRALSPDEYHDLIACIFFDLLVTKLLPLAGTLWAEKNNIDVRSRIGALYSLRYSETLLKLLCGYEMLVPVRERIVSLRGAWFGRTKEESLALLEEVSRESVTLIIDMVQAFAGYTRARYPQAPAAKFNNERYALIFSGQWTPEQFFKNYSRGHIHFSLGNRKLEHDTLLLPGELSIYLGWYASGTGLFSTRVRKAYRGDALLHIPAGALAHLEALDTAFKDYAESGGAHKIPYVYGFRATPSRWRSFASRVILTLLQ